jgi:hypothetical protein
MGKSILILCLFVFYVSGQNQFLLFHSFFDFFVQFFIFFLDLASFIFFNFPLNFSADDLAAVPNEPGIFDFLIPRTCEFLSVAVARVAAPEFGAASAFGLGNIDTEPRSLPFSSFSLAFGQFCSLFNIQVSVRFEIRENILSVSRQGEN